MAVLGLVAGGCKSTKEARVSSGAARTSFEPTFVKSELDGGITLRAWGQGANTGDAIEQAKKSAVMTVLFKGVPDAPGAYRAPLVPEVNAQERYAVYFDPFFSDGGEYRRFAREVKAGESSRLVSKGSGVCNIGVLVEVDRGALRSQLLQDGVIK